MLSASLSSKVDSFLSGNNSVYVEQMFDAWKQNEQKVDSLQKQVASASSNVLSKLA